MTSSDRHPESRPLIGLMLGDATGIGPEICAKVLAAGSVADVARIVVIGDSRVFEQGMRDASVDVPYSRLRSIDEMSWPRNDVPLVDLGNIDPQVNAIGSAVFLVSITLVVIAQMLIMGRARKSDQS